MAAQLGARASQKAQRLREAHQQTQKAVTHLGRKVSVFTCIKQKKKSNPAKLPLYNMNYDIKFSVKHPKGRVCLQLSCYPQPQQREAPRHF